MVMLIDDLILRQFGISIPPFDLIWLFEIIYDTAYNEFYDMKRIKDQIKENRLLFELSEITKEEYEETNKKLMSMLEIAKKVKKMDLDKKVDILNLGISMLK